MYHANNSIKLPVIFCCDSACDCDLLSVARCPYNHGYFECDNSCQGYVTFVTPHMDYIINCACPTHNPFEWTYQQISLKQIIKHEKKKYDSTHTYILELDSQKYDLFLKYQMKQRKKFCGTQALSQPNSSPFLWRLKYMHKWLTYNAEIASCLHHGAGGEDDALKYGYILVLSNDTLDLTNESDLDGWDSADHSLPVTKPNLKTTYGTDKTENRLPCAICTESCLEAGPCQWLKCSHVFHMSCISEWLKIKNTCPLCRISIP